MLLVSLISGDTCAYAVSPHAAYGSVQSVVSPFVFLHAKEISQKKHRWGAGRILLVQAFLPHPCLPLDCSVLGIASYGDHYFIR